MELRWGGWSRFEATRLVMAYKLSYMLLWGLVPVASQFISVIFNEVFHAMCCISTSLVEAYWWRPWPYLDVMQNVFGCLFYIVLYLQLFNADPEFCILIMSFLQCRYIDGFTQVSGKFMMRFFYWIGQVLSFFGLKPSIWSGNTANHHRVPIWSSHDFNVQILVVRFSI